jgi:tetratricopeptide (TPR) repeat protein
MTKKATSLKRRISDWLESTRGARVQTGISPAVAMRRARQLRREIVHGEVKPRDFILDDDFKSVLYALVSLVTAGGTRLEVRNEVKSTNEFVRGIRWRADTFAEKAELLSELKLHEARVNVLGHASSASEQDLPQGDLFRKRPHLGSASGLNDMLSFEKTVSSASKLLAKRMMEVAFQSSEDIVGFLQGLDLAVRRNTDAMLLAVKDLGLEIARDPIRLLTFVSLLLPRIERERAASSKTAKSVRNYWSYILAWTHRLAGMALLQAGDFPRAGPHLQKAYRLLVMTSRSDFDLASVEFVESQRRTFMSRAQEGLALARRTHSTYDSLGLASNAARAKVAAGMALGMLGRYEAAVAEYFAAIPEFEERQLWSNYIGAVNSLGLALTRLGRFDEARRAYAKALRRFSRPEHASWMPLVRHGLAELLLASGRYEDAAHSFREVRHAIEDLPFGYWHLKWGLQEVEAWARAGELERAQRLLEDLLSDAESHGALDLAMSRRLRKAVGGKVQNLERLGKLREEMVRVLVSRAADTPRHVRRGSRGN